MWAGILNNRLIVPFFINGNLTAHPYAGMLTNEVISVIRQIINVDIRDIWFWQGKAVLYFDINVRRLLDTAIPHRWIGRKG